MTNDKEQKSYSLIELSRNKMNTAELLVQCLENEYSRIIGAVPRK